MTSALPDIRFAVVANAFVSRCLSSAVLVALVAAAPAALAQNAEADARTHFAAGVNLLRDPAKPRYEEAYREFRAAYALNPSYKILGNVALCAMKLERDEEAVVAYERYLKEAVDLDPAERQQIERDILTLKAGIVRLVVDGVPAGASVLDTRIPAQGEPLTNVYGPLDGAKTTLGVRRGHHILRVRVSGRPEQTWELDAESGQLEHAFDFSAPPPEPPRPVAPVPVAPPPQEVSRPVPTSVWISGGATLAVLGGALVVGAVAASKRSDFDAINDGSDVRAAEALRSDGRTLNVVSDVLLGTAVIGVAVTTYLFVTRPSASAARTGVVTTPFLARF